MTRPKKAQPSRVLVVEDEVLIAMDLEEWLTEHGFEVIGPFKRSVDALAALEQSEIQFAVLDYLLENENSSAIADRLGQLGVPYVFLTGCHDFMRSTIGRGTMAIEKPISRTQMTEIFAKNGLTPCGRSCEN